MGCNDNDHVTPPPPRDPPREVSRDTSPRQFEETSLSGDSNTVAMALVSLDAAHSLSLMMQNAVVEQQNGWTTQRIVMMRAIDQLLRNPAGDRAVDLLLQSMRRPEPANS